MHIAKAEKYLALPGIVLKLKQALIIGCKGKSITIISAYFCMPGMSGHAMASILHEMAMLVDVLNNVLDDYHEWHCQEHAGCIQELAAQDDAQDDGNGM